MSQHTAIPRSRQTETATVARIAVPHSGLELQAESAADALTMGGCPGPVGSVGTAQTIAANPAATANAAKVAETPGQPLDPRERVYFESRFGRDLSGIRLHTDAAAGLAAQGIGAGAYTLRNHIAFAPGAYSPDSISGRRTLAHELTHALQQGKSGPALIQRTPPTVNPEIASLPGNRYVDAFAEVNYDLDYRAVGGNLSRWLTVTYPDGAQIDIGVFDILDQDVSMLESMAAGHLGPQGRIFPRELTRTTVPRLWEARTEAIGIMEQHNLEFMMAAMPAVLFIITLAGMPPTSAPRVTTRSVTRPRRIPTRPATGGGSGGTTTQAPGPTAATGGTAAVAGTGAAAPRFRLLSSRVMRYSGRDIVVVETRTGAQAFYRRTGLGGSNAGGAQTGQWAPFDGILAGWFDKGRYVAGSADDVLYRFGSRENRAVSEWLGQQGIRAGNEVGEVFSLINQFLDDLGALRMGGG